VNEREAQFLLDWMTANREAATQWPANVLSPRLAEMLADRQLDQSEQAELLTLLHKITAGGQPIREYAANFSTSLPLTRPAPAIHFLQRNFCFTGKFSSGTRTQCEGATIAKGGRTQKEPTGETDYLVIGRLGSSDWIHSTHGRKIEKAVEYRDRGFSIDIVSEEHWLKYITVD
jgi:NAD-dependent DNA ligase